MHNLVSQYDYVLGAIGEYSCRCDTQVQVIVMGLSLIGPNIQSGSDMTGTELYKELCLGGYIVTLCIILGCRKT
jgi:hypothetical protein